MKHTSKKRKTRFMCMLLLLALLLSGCGGSPSGDGNGDNEGGNTSAEGDYEGYYKTYLTASIATMNFLTDADGTSTELYSRSGLRLYNYVPDGNGGASLEGELAVSDPVCLDGDAGTTWEITLRENAKWQNGDAITADDFIFSMQTALDPEQLYTEGSKAANGLVEIQNAAAYLEQYAPGNSPVSWEDVGIKKTGDYTIQIITEYKTNAEKIKQHFNMPSTMLVHQATYESCWDSSHAVNSYGSSLDKYMSCGEYILTEWVTDSKYVLEKNPDYVHADLIKLPGIVYRVVADNNTALELFLQGELTQVALGSAEIENYLQDPRYMSDPPLQQLNVLINNRNTDNNGILNNLNFRKALFYATDRESIAALRNAIPATYILGTKMIVDESGTTFRSLESSSAYLPENYGYDPEYAKECYDLAMEECGLTSLNLTVIFSESSPNQRPIAEYIQTSWKEIFGDSFTLTLDPKPTTVAYSQRKGWTSNPNSYELAIEGYVPVDNILTDALKFYTTGYPNANEYNNNERVDALYQEAVYGEQALNDNDYLISLVQQMEQILIYEDYITCPVFEIPNAWLLDEHVQLPVTERVPGGGWMTDYAEFVTE